MTNAACLSIATQLKSFADDLVEVGFEPTFEFEKAVAALFAAPLLMTPRDMICAVSMAMNVSVTDILSRKRSGRIAHVRQLAMYFCRKTLPTPSFPRIGQLFGRDHSTVMHAVHKIGQRPPDLFTQRAIEKSLAAIVLARRSRPEVAA